MNAIIAVQDLIKQNNERVNILKNQLKDHESGVRKLSKMAKASTENSIEKSKEALEKNEMILKELQKYDAMELEKENRIKEAIKRNNYYKFQKIRIKRDINKSDSQKLEAMMIVDELPSDVSLEDSDVFNIAETTIKLDLRTHDELDEQLKEIKIDFQELLKNVKNEDIGRLGMLEIHIPILVLHLCILISNIEENIKDEKLASFKGLPKYEDWWINELWYNHQAYFGLYKWKAIVQSLCITAEQKKAWGTIFANWVFIKKLLNKKGALAFEFNFAFDTLMKHHTGLEEQLDIQNLKNMEKIVKDITSQENFSKFEHKHNIETPYLQYKKAKIEVLEAMKQ
ncbi:MAG: hypothetical protein U9N59_02110 [Campylobacterota bacterium]|nr:hypothetical protein [Campylobacterota bacterium]